MAGLHAKPATRHMPNPQRDSCSSYCVPRQRIPVDPPGDVPGTGAQYGCVYLGEETHFRRQVDDHSEPAMSMGVASASPRQWIIPKVEQTQARSSASAARLAIDRATIEIGRRMRVKLRSGGEFPLYERGEPYVAGVGGVVAAGCGQCVTYANAQTS